MSEEEYRCAVCGEAGDGNLHYNPEHDEDHPFEIAED